MTDIRANELRTNLINELAAVIEDAGITCVAELDGSTETKSLTVFRSFPREAEFALPAVSITLGRGETEHVFGELKREEEVAGEPTRVRLVWRKARVIYPVQLDLWTSSLNDRYQLAPQLFDLFDGGDERPHGLELVLADSLDADARVRWLDDDEQDERDRDRGIRRLLVRLEAHTERLRASELDRATYTATTGITPG